MKYSSNFNFDGKIVREIGPNTTKIQILGSANKDIDPWVNRWGSMLWRQPSSIGIRIIEKRRSRDRHICIMEIYISKAMLFKRSPEPYSYFLISGIGNGLIQCPKFIALSLWFENRRGRATSLAMMMDGCGALAMAPLLQASFHFYGYTGALVILAGLTLQYTVSGAILRSPFAFEMRKFKNRSASCRQHGYTPENDDVDPGENSVTKCNLGVGSIDDLYFVPPVYSRRLSRSLHILPSPDIKILTPTSNRCKALWKSQRDIPDDQNSMIKANSEVILKSSANQSMGYDLEYFDASENQNERTDSGCQCENYFNYKLLRDSRYLAFNMLAVCITLCGSMTNTHLAGLCKEHGMNGVEIVTLLAIMGGVNTTFKFLSGFLFDWPPVKQYRKHIFCVMSFSFGLMQVLSPYMQSLAAFYGVWIMYMTTGAFMATQESVILADLVDRQAFASGIGLNRFFRSFGVLIGPTFGGKYETSFTWLGRITHVTILFWDL